MKFKSNRIVNYSNLHHFLVTIIVIQYARTIFIVERQGCVYWELEMPWVSADSTGSARAAAQEMTREVNETLSAGGRQWGRTGPRIRSAGPVACPAT